MRVENSANYARPSSNLPQTHRNPTQTPTQTLNPRPRPRRYVFQAVHMLFEGLPERPWRADEPRVSRLVIIGRELDREVFEQALSNCLVARPGGPPPGGVPAGKAAPAGAAK